MARLPWRKDESDPDVTVYHNPATCVHSDSETRTDNGDGSADVTRTCSKCDRVQAMTVGPPGSAADWLS